MERCFTSDILCLLQATAISSGVSINILISSIYRLGPNRSYLPPFRLASSQILHLQNELGIIDIPPLPIIFNFNVLHRLIA